MAKKAKRETALTPEEKLEQALVPNTEYPYKIPANWCWTKIGVFSSLYRGVSYKKNDAHSEKHENDCLILRGGNIGEGFIDTESDNVYVDMSFVNKNQLVRNNDIIIVASTGSTKVIGRAGISETDYSDVAFGAFLILVRPNENTVPKYMGLFFQSDLYRNRIRNSVSGININNIRSEYITESPYPFPPLAEQQRIIDRIESLFAKLDEAKEKAQAVVDSYEERRAAILHKAFTGELTEKWRIERGISLETWRKITIKDVCYDVKVGIVIKPSQYYTDESTGTPAFRSANVREFHIDDCDWVYLNEKGMSDNKRSIVHTGDVLIVRSGNPGTACVVEEKYNGYNAIDILIAVPNNHLIISEYLCAFTNSPLGKKQVAENKRGIALTHFNVSGYSKLILDLPSISEQKEIIDKLFMLLNTEQQVCEYANNTIEQVETIKKSILSRAFRGELGTNDSNDESAIELLKRVLK